MAVRPGRTASGFDRLARVYDRLAGLVYGRSLRRAQTCMLPHVKRGGEALVLGGGTGWFLEALLQNGPVARLCYVELSGKMLEISRERIRSRFPEMEGKIEWVQGTVHDLEQEARFDLVCTHCFLDLFEGEALQREAEAIGKRMREDAQWYFSDFKVADRWPMRWISKALIWLMYRFFRLWAGIPAGRLGDFRGAMRKQGFEVEKQQEYFGGMIEAALLSRTHKQKGLHEWNPLV